ncbi:MAG: undecaprenyl-diphosphate phosphatase [Deltaproteobacteria bacterium]|nr:MAG: undecaprenyl-diphosphate phosphatase [Deltaproteobacteria bacterium]
MPVWQALVYGIVQGLAEFLPISSSAHLTLLPWAMGWEDPGLAFDVALHWGTLAAVLAVFWRDWIRLISAALGRGSDTDRRLFWCLVISAIPGAIIGKLLDKWAEENLRAPLRAGRKSRQLDQMTLGRAVSIGVAQAAALVPGVSRSGATITLGLFQDFTRDEIARFSFLMSTPIIFGAGLVKLPKMLHEMRSGEGPVTWAALAVGFVASAVVGTFVIRWMLDYLRRRTYAVFAGYRVALAAAVVLLWLSGKR